MKTRLLSRKDIESFFTMKMCMEAVEKAFADLATGNATLPQRTPITVPTSTGSLSSCRPTSRAWGRWGPRW